MAKEKPVENYQLFDENQFLSKVNLFLNQVHFLFTDDDDKARFVDKSYEEFVLSEDYSISGLFETLKGRLEAFLGHPIGEEVET